MWSACSLVSGVQKNCPAVPLDLDFCPESEPNVLSGPLWVRQEVPAGLGGWAGLSLHVPQEVVDRAACPRVSPGRWWMGWPVLSCPLGGGGRGDLSSRVRWSISSAAPEHPLPRAASPRPGLSRSEQVVLCCRLGLRGPQPRSVVVRPSPALCWVPPHLWPLQAARWAGLLICLCC